MNYLKELIFKRGGNGHHAGRTNFIFNCILIFLVFCISIAFTGCGGDSSDDDSNKFDYSLGANNIGKTGPGGGKIFYYSESGFTDSYTGETCHYLEAAPADMGTLLAWEPFPSLIIGGGGLISVLGLGIGSGRMNTTTILYTAIDYYMDPDPGTNVPAAYACNTYTNNGKSDWFLPSKGELNELYKQKNLFTNFGTTGYPSHIYWSSSLSSSCPWVQYFNDGTQFSDHSMTNAFSVRAIRSF